MADDKLPINTAFSFRTVCTTAYNNNEGNCSGLVKDVAQSLGLFLPDLQANELVDYLANNWECITDDAAQVYADRSRMVVAGLKDPTTNGHVLVIVPFGKARSGGYKYVDRKTGETMTAAYHGDYPRSCSRALGGWEGADSNGDKSAYDAWSHDKYPKVRYWLAPLPGEVMCTKLPSSTTTATAGP